MLTVLGINMLTVDVFQVPTVLIFNSSSSFFANTREIAEQTRLLISAEAEISNEISLPKFNFQRGLTPSYAGFPLFNDTNNVF